MYDGAVKRSNTIAEAMHDINITLRTSVKKWRPRERVCVVVGTRYKFFNVSRTRMFLERTLRQLGGSTGEMFSLSYLEKQAPNQEIQDFP